MSEVLSGNNSDQIIGPAFLKCRASRHVIEVRDHPFYFVYNKYTIQNLLFKIELFFTSTIIIENNRSSGILER